jgi:hypothetical protein
MHIMKFHPKRAWMELLALALAVGVMSGRVINAQASSSEVEAHNSSGGSFANDGAPNGGPAEVPGTSGGPGGPSDPGSGAAPRPSPTPETFSIAFDVQASGKEVKQDCAVCHWLEVHIDGKKLDFGKTATLRKDKSYEITVKDNPETRGSPPQGSTPPHDSNQRFTVWPKAVDGQSINASNDKKILFAQKDEVLEYLIDNSQEMLTENKTWESGVLQKKAMLIPVKIATPTRPYGNATTEVGPINNLLGVWREQEIKIRVDLKDLDEEIALPPNFIIWSVPSSVPGPTNQIPVNQREATLSWLNYGLKQILITIGGKKFRVVIDVPDVGDIEQSQAILMDPLV